MAPSMITWPTCRPFGPNSRAMPCATARSAAFADAKAVKGGRARRLAVAPVKIKRAAAARQHAPRGLAAGQKAAEAAERARPTRRARRPISRSGRHVRIAGVVDDELRCVGHRRRRVEEPHHVGGLRRVHRHGARGAAGTAERRPRALRCAPAFRPPRTRAGPRARSGARARAPSPALAPTPITIAVRVIWSILGPHASGGPR